MAYAPGDDIRASHYNGFRDQINDFWAVGNGDMGYGQPDLPTVFIGKLVEGVEWQDLINSVEMMASHQGSTLPSDWAGPTFFEKGDVVVAHEGTVRPFNPAGYDLQPGLTLVQTNYLNVNPANQTLLSSAFSSNQTITWGDTLEYTFTVEFSDEDNARWFFNTGGQIRITTERTGGTSTPPNSTQNQSWTDLLNAVGTISFNYDTTTSTGIGSSGGIGYYDLTNAFQTCWSANASGAYSANQFRVQARSTTITGVRGAKGNTIEFRLQFLDNHPDFWIPGVPNGGSFPNANAPLPLFDQVDGDHSTSVDVRKSALFTSIETPTFISGLWVGTGP